MLKELIRFHCFRQKLSCTSTSSPSPSPVEYRFDDHQRSVKAWLALDSFLFVVNIWNALDSFLFVVKMSVCFFFSSYSLLYFCVLHILCGIYLLSYLSCPTFFGTFSHQCQLRLHLPPIESDRHHSVPIVKDVMLPILKCCLIVNNNAWFERYLFLFVVPTVICKIYTWQHYLVDHQYLTDQTMCFCLHFEASMIYVTS